MKKLLFFGLLFLTMSGYAQKTPQDIIKDFFSTYENDPGKAVKEMYKTNLWTERIKDNIENIANNLNGFTLDFVGKYYGYEFITYQYFTNSFVLYSYLVKYDRQPLRFTFKFYKPHDTWVLYGFQYDDTFSTEIEEAAKLNYLYQDR
jgi:hypothetical protein